MSKLGAYKITSKLGEGGMATVYKGVQVSLRRPVAIKVLSQNLTSEPDLLERFKQESLIIARLTHPNIIHVIDRGVTKDGRPYFVMEYVEGHDLAHWVRTGSFDLNRRLDVVIQVCKALAYAHRNGVVHRDIKPANILIDGDGNARVLDFGIAQFTDRARVADARTEAGVVMGTYAYMSPEQAEGARRVTAASDLYSLGAVMYELFTGTRPQGRLKPPTELDPSLPAGIDEVILRCLEPDPRHRFGSAGEVRDRLLQLLRGAHLDSEQRARADQGLARIEDRFALLDVIKEDSHGAVLLYEQRDTHKLLVIKKKPARRSGLTEARMLNTLKHPHIVNVVGASGNDQAFIVVMEYLSGGSLRDRLVRPIAWPEAVEIARQAAEGLAFAHRNRILHGNLRPTNMLFSEDGTVELTDFGLEEHYGDAVDGGTNWYGVAGEPRSPRADLFALGVILYQMVTGVLPAWHGDGPTANPAFLNLPRALQGVIEQMLHLAPEGRPPSADAVVEVFERVLDQADPAVAGADPTVVEDPTVVVVAESQPAPPPVRRPVGRTLVLMAVLAGVAGYYLRSTGGDAVLLESFRRWLAEARTFVEPYLSRP